MSNKVCDSPLPVSVARGAALEFIAASHENPQNPGALKKVLFNSALLPSGKIQMVNWAKVPRGKGFQSHYHEDMYEVFVIIAGEAEMLVDGSKTTLKNGDAILIPPGSIHSMTALGDRDIDYLVFGISQEKGGKTVVVE